jgi:type II secretory pathway pseudopilin PulG
MFFKRNQKINNQSGFTLIEVVLIMFLISFSFVGIYRVLSNISQHEKDNRYNLIAANLAQEGVEIVRNKRDENVLNKLIINKGLPEGNCVPHWEGEDAECDSNKEKEVRLDGNNVYRNCDSTNCGSGSDWKETPFERECTVSGDAEELTVKCRVEWESPSLKKNKKIEIESLLTDWQGN